MGIFFSSLWKNFAGDSELKICIIGLDNAGKTTILYKLHLGEAITTTPTIGSNVEGVTYKNLRFQMWDLGGQDTLRTNWALYYLDTNCVIMVIDSSDKERLDIAREELHKALNSEFLHNSILLVLANKQDIKGALSVPEISDILGLHSLKQVCWHIEGCCALTGKGLFEGMDWVAENIKQE